MASERTFRRTLKELGYRLHKHGDLYDLIDTSKNFLVVGDTSLEQIAAHVADLHFPAPKQ